MFVYSVFFFPVNLEKVPVKFNHKWLTQFSAQARSLWKSEISSFFSARDHKTCSLFVGLIGLYIREAKFHLFSNDMKFHETLKIKFHNIS